MFGAVYHVSKISLYFFQASQVTKKLPDPNRELSVTSSPAAIREANREVVAMEVTECVC